MGNHLNHVSQEISEVTKNVLEDSVTSDTIKDMRPEFFYPIALVTLVCMIGLFFLILVAGYRAQIKQRYLSPSVDADAELCDTVLISNSGDFLLSLDGYWEGTNEFNYTDAQYVISTKNMQVSTVVYGGYIDYFQEQVNYIAQNISPQLDLGYNLLFWMSYVIRQPGSESNRFYMNGDPLTVFDRQYTAGSLTSQYGDCANAATGSFDRANGLLSVRFDVSKYQADNCSLISDPALLGYLPRVSPSSFDVKVDVRSLVTAVSVNINIISLTDLQYIRGTDTSFTTSTGITVPLAQYVDVRYPGMQAIYCSSHPAFQHCIISVAQVLALPIFLHRGASLQEPIYCDCTLPSIQAKLNDTDFDCHLFQFMTGLLFYPTSDPGPLVELGVRYSAKELQVKSMAPIFAGSSFASMNATTLSDLAYRQSIYDFCASSNYSANMTCRFVTFSSFDVGLQSSQRPVSAQLHQIPAGACSDSFSMSENSWARVRSTPFSPLTQEYEVCQNDPVQTISDNLGIASGDISLVLPLWILLIVFLIHSVQRCGVRHGGSSMLRRRFPAKARGDVLDQLAVMLLHEQEAVTLSTSGANHHTKADSNAQSVTRTVDSVSYPRTEMDQKEAYADEEDTLSACQLPRRSRKLSAALLWQDLATEMQEIEANPSLLYGDPPANNSKWLQRPDRSPEDENLLPQLLTTAGHTPLNSSRFVDTLNSSPATSAINATSLVPMDVTSTATTASSSGMKDHGSDSSSFLPYLVSLFTSVPTKNTAPITTATGHIGSDVELAAVYPHSDTHSPPSNLHSTTGGTLHLTNVSIDTSNQQAGLVLNVSDRYQVQCLQQRRRLTADMLLQSVPVYLEYLDGVFLSLMQVYVLYQQQPPHHSLPVDSDLMAKARTNAALGVTCTDSTAQEQGFHPPLETQPLYRNACHMLQQLSTHRWQLLSDRSLWSELAEDERAQVRPVYMKLATILLLHGALVLRMDDLAEVQRGSSQRLHYCLGPRLVSLADLQTWSM